MSDIEYRYGHKEHLLEELVNSDITSFRKLYLKDRKVKTLC